MNTGKWIGIIAGGFLIVILTIYAMSLSTLEDTGQLTVRDYEHHWINPPPEDSMQYYRMNRPEFSMTDTSLSVSIKIENAPVTLLELSARHHNDLVFRVEQQKIDTPDVVSLDGIDLTYFDRTQPVDFLVWYRYPQTGYEARQDMVLELPE